MLTPVKYATVCGVVRWVILVYNLPKSESLGRRDWGAIRLVGIAICEIGGGGGADCGGFSFIVINDDVGS